MINKEINIYCDESCHLLHESEVQMFVSCTYCPKSEVKRISEEIRNLKRKHNIWRYAEIKWTKVSNSKESFYMDLLDYFLNESALSFRTIIIPDKHKLEHEKFGQNHNSWYYKMIYLLVKYIIRFNKDNNYYIYIDKKENSFQAKRYLLKLKECIEAYFEKDIHVQNILSHQSEIMQLNDFLQGIVSYSNRKNNFSGNLNQTKLKLIEHIEASININLSISNEDKKYNIFKWSPK